jgi:hypothetical protein
LAASSISPAELLVDTKRAGDLLAPEPASSST